MTGTGHAFAAVKSDGSVVTWGHAYHGGDSRSVAVQLAGGVKSVTGSGCAFAAVKSEGSVVTWGGVKNGGDSRSVVTVCARRRIVPLGRRLEFRWSAYVL